MRWLARYTRGLAVATWLLVIAGGLVTSTSSGLSVPDWPTTYGYQMFRFPLSAMTGPILFEHGHRLVASTVGFLTIGLVALQWRLESRRWVRRLGWLALGAVVAQGVLGGLTVLFLLPDAISISHAGLAEIFFALTAAIALVSSRTWRTPPRAPVDDPALARQLVVLTSIVYVQILIGATMRHTGAGLAIPDFPLSYGRLWPPFWPFGVAINYTHRIGALIVTLLVAATTITIWRRHGGHPELTRPALWLLALTGVQITLGASVIWSRRQVIINTAHVATGALVFITAVCLTLRAFRVRFGEAQ